MKFDLSSISIAILAAALAPVANCKTVCQPGEIGVGQTDVYQWSGTQNTLAAQNPGIYTHDCNSIAFSNVGLQTNPCVGNYGPGTGVQCDGNGHPNFVWTTGGNFHNCYGISNGQCATGPFTYVNVYFCCQRW